MSPRPELDALVTKAIADFAALSPEQQETVLTAQRESYGRHMSLRGERQAITHTDQTPDAKDRASILAAMDYRSGPDSCNSVYLGSMATAGLYQILGLKYGQPGFDAALESCTRDQLDDLLAATKAVREHMADNPTMKCQVCGGVTTPTDQHGVAVGDAGLRERFDEAAGVACVIPHASFDVSVKLSRDDIRAISAALASTPHQLSPGASGERDALAEGWLKADLAKVNADVAAWPAGIRASFEATHGPLAVPSPPAEMAGVEEVEEAYDAAHIAAWEIARPYIAVNLRAGRDPGPLSDQSKDVQEIGRMEIVAAIQVYLAALRTRQDTRAGSAVEGWQMVPREPTKAMNNAGSYCQRSDNGEADDIYAAMLAAAPTTPTGTDDGEGV